MFFAEIQRRNLIAYHNVFLIAYPASKGCLAFEMSVGEHTNTSSGRLLKIYDKMINIIMPVLAIINWHILTALCHVYIYDTFSICVSSILKLSTLTVQSYGRSKK